MARRESCSVPGSQGRERHLSATLAARPVISADAKMLPAKLALPGGAAPRSARRCMEPAAARLYGEILW